MKVLLITKDGSIKLSEVSNDAEAKLLVQKGFRVVAVDMAIPTEYRDGTWYGINSFVEYAKPSQVLRECEAFRQWHTNWIEHTNDEGTETYRAFEPDNTCIYEGTNPNDACKALNESGFTG